MLRYNSESVPFVEDNTSMSLWTFTYLTQHVFKTSQHIPGQNSSILDLFFTSDPNVIEMCNIILLWVLLIMNAYF